MGGLCMEVPLGFSTYGCHFAICAWQTGQTIRWEPCTLTGFCLSLTRPGAAKSTGEDRVNFEILSCTVQRLHLRYFVTRTTNRRLWSLHSPVVLYCVVCGRGLNASSQARAEALASFYCVNAARELYVLAALIFA